jgi:hypothetical protein
MLMAIITSLEGQVTWPAVPYVTTSFAMHSTISTIQVTQNVINGELRPPRRCNQQR